MLGSSLQTNCRPPYTLTNPMLGKYGLAVLLPTPPRSSAARRRETGQSNPAARLREKGIFGARSYLPIEEGDEDEQGRRAFFRPFLLWPKRGREGGSMCKAISIFSAGGPFLRCTAQHRTRKEEEEEPTLLASKHFFLLLFRLPCESPPLSFPL